MVELVLPFYPLHLELLLLRPILLLCLHETFLVTSGVVLGSLLIM